MMSFRIKVGLFYAAFTLNGFNDQKRNLTFVKTYFQVLKLKFYRCNISPDPGQHKYTFMQVFLSVPGFQTCMCKRGIN